MYNHLEVEKKWQEYWDKNKTFKCDVKKEGPKYFCLDMFPYPSGAGLHVGHPLSYTATDILSRYKRMKGFNVLHPMGFDAFGLPAEKYALDTGNDPREFTYKNIETFTRQLKELGFSYDWDRSFSTTDPEYFKWTQWIFMQIYNKGLAEVRNVEVNWCPEMRTVLSNEEVLNQDGKMVSERGGFPVVKKNMKQWVLKITEYAERLLTDLDELDWPQSTKTMQREWIGKSIGATVNFEVANTKLSFNVFTTRPDTLFGATYCVLSPEHALINLESEECIVTEENRKDVQEYVDRAKAQSEIERTSTVKEKTGVFTGAYAVNPVNSKQVPIYISDYVLVSYGEGAIMAVPAHDDRDYEFAKKFNLDIVPVLDGDVSESAFTGDGLHINSEFLDGLNKEDAIKKVIEHLEKSKKGTKKINYKLRDWIFARQRYWGEPFPVVYWEDGTVSLIDEKELPLELPVIKDMKPSGTGESPLVHAKDWLSVTREDGVKGTRDTNTMPNWAGSCWYYMGYLLKNDGKYTPMDSKDAQKIFSDWLPVDQYVGGAEHSVLHLLYARFWHKVLYDCGVVDSKEPFQKLDHQGMILGEDNRKMSKSLGNVVNPDDIVKEFGADTLRLYEMFMGPLQSEKPWNSAAVSGSRRFIDKIYRMYTEIATIKDTCPELDKIYNQTIKKVESDYISISYNTAISQMMIFVNEVYKVKAISKAQAEGFIKLIYPIIPHIAEEIYSSILGNKDSITYAKWPEVDESKLKEDKALYIIQVNGKLRDKIECSIDTSKDDVLKLALSSDKVKQFIESKEIVKTIVVPKKLVNIVVK